MNDWFEPTSVEDLSDVVRSASLVIPRGGCTKPRLSDCGAVSTISLRHLSGIVDYVPAEFTFTARAGTPLSEIIAVLAEKGQYLPWDPPLVRAGATLGGAVAAGFNGPGRLRFGGLRDFILGVRFVDGRGQILRMGGRVVKNAAGFDLPKFLVGSLGRFGVLGEITFKVFPRPASSITLEFTASSEPEMMTLIGTVAKGRWEVEALEIPVGESRLYSRLGGPVEALPELAADLGRRWPVRRLEPEEASALWRGAADFSWAHPEGVLCKVPLTLSAVPRFTELVRGIPQARAWIGAAGSVGYLSLPVGADSTRLDAALSHLGWSGLVWRGNANLWLGSVPDFNIHAAVKAALDPDSRFPSIR